MQKSGEVKRSMGDQIVIEFVKVFRSGFCQSFERLALQNGRITKKVKFPAIWALIKHEREGYILFDTGYSRHVKGLMKKFPECIYGKVLMIDIPSEEDIKEQLRCRNISTEDIKYIILSHLHADHIGGARYFTESKFIYSKNLIDLLHNPKKSDRLKKGFFRQLLPEDILERSYFVEDLPVIECDDLRPFSSCYDLFRDGSIKIVHLEGHAYGQIGIFVQVIQSEKNSEFFFISDACWQKENYENLRLPGKFARKIFDNNFEFEESVKKIRNFHKNRPDVTIVPSHCSATLERIWGND